MCGSRKCTGSPSGRSLESPRGKGVLKAKLFKENYETKLEFPGWVGGGGGDGVIGFKTKNLPWSEYGFFWNYTMLSLCGISVTK